MPTMMMTTTPTIEDHIGPFWHSQMSQKGQFHLSAIISLLDKPGKDHLYLNSWRPLSLNTDIWKGVS